MTHRLADDGVQCLEGCVHLSEEPVIVGVVNVVLVQGCCNLQSAECTRLRTELTQLHERGIYSVLKSSLHTALHP